MQDHSTEDRRDGRTLTYEAPAIEERAPISAPLNTVAQTKFISPSWHRPEND